MAINKFIHIGFPKCASSALQFSYFCDHPEIYHLGLGYGKRLKYISDEVNIAAEIDIRHRKSYDYDAEKVKAIFKPYFEEADKDDQYKAIGLSSELFSFTYTTDVDPLLKAQRLHGIFGDDTKIIMITRNQFSLLKSWYFENVKEGYPFRYREFMNFTYQFQDRNWCHDFCFHNIFNTYAEVFGEENVEVIPFEVIKHQSSKKFVDIFSEKIGVSEPELDLGHLNQKLELDTIGYMMDFNKQFVRSLGRSIFEPNILTRYKPYFTKELGIDPPMYMEIDRKVKNILRQELGGIQNHPRKEINVSGLVDMSYSEEVHEALAKMFAESNQELQRLTGLDLEKYSYLV